MVKKSKGNKSAYKQKSIFTNISKLVFINKKLSLAVFTAILVFGVLSYTTFMRREGFPPVQVPVAVGVGQYFVDDAEKVDKEVSQPVAELVRGLDEVTSVQTVSENNIFSIVAELSSGVNNTEGNKLVADAVSESGILPEGSQLEMVGVNASKFLGEYDLLVSVFSDGDDSIDEVIAKSAILSDKLSELELIGKSEVISPFTVNPSDETDRFQSTFSRAFDSSDSQLKQAVTVGVAGTGNEDFDLFKLDEAVELALEDYNSVAGQSAEITVDGTSDVTQQISSLQSNVLMGAAVVAVISALMISVRVSILTSVFIVAVLLTTIGIMYLAGFTLNVITLFSLVLALGLFVDDATIIAESIYAKKDPKKKPLQVVSDAINSIGTASFAGTLTTVLVFSPLLFIPGVLGDFIYYIPVTVIISLLTSFVLSITLIPLLANYTILGDKQEKRKNNIIGEFLAGMIEKMKTSPLIGFGWGVSMMVLSFVVIISGFGMFGALGQDNFPSARDGNNLLVTIRYPENTKIEQAVEIAEEVDEKVLDILDGEIEQAMYGLLNSDSPQLSNETVAGLQVLLTSFQDRSVTSVELSELIEQEFVDYERAQIDTVALNGGPPAAEFPFLVQIDIGEDKQDSLSAASEISAFLKEQEIELSNGDKVKIVKTELDFINNIVRVDGVQQIEIKAKFNVDGTTEATAELQKLVEEEFNDDRLSAYNLEQDNIGFDFGQDSEFNESLSALFLATVVALSAMIILLTVQFFEMPAKGSSGIKYPLAVLSSLAKILLILFALPFSVFGVALGLSLTGNALSFFVFIGMTGLIGIAVNNTILLVDNAVHHQKSGMDSIDAMAQAVRERFRPLATTTLTTIAALIPLALSDPFWEAMSATIIFGLASSTLLVIFAFPYYYLFFPSLGRGLRAIYNKIRGGK